MPRAPSEKVTQAEKLFNDGMPMVEIAKNLVFQMVRFVAGRTDTDGGKTQKKTSATLRKRVTRKVQRCRRKSVADNRAIKMPRAVLEIRIPIPHQIEQSTEGMFRCLWMLWTRMSRI